MTPTRSARTSPARNCVALAGGVLAALLFSCDDSDHGAGPPPSGAEIRVMAEVERYSEDGTSLLDVTVVVSQDGAPVTGADVTLNGSAVPSQAAGRYRALGMAAGDPGVVSIAVSSGAGSRTQSGLLPGPVILRRPTAGESFADGASIPVSWESVDWDSAAAPREITVEYTQGEPFYFVTLPADAVEHEIAAAVTRPSAMEFLIVAAWAGHPDPGSLERGDWLGRDGLRLGSRAVTWLEITD